MLARIMGMQVWLSADRGVGEGQSWLIPPSPSPTPPAKNHNCSTHVSLYKVQSLAAKASLLLAEVISLCQAGLAKTSQCWSLDSAGHWIVGCPIPL